MPAPPRGISQERVVKRNRMPLSWKSLAALFAIISLSSPAFPQAAAKKKPAAAPAHPAAAAAPAGPAQLTERQRALHALNRLTFGPRPGDLETVLAKGVDNWIEDQLHPESIADSAAQS